MCIICVDIDKGRLDPWEASRNRREMLSELSEEHLRILDNKIKDCLKEYLNGLNLKKTKKNKLFTP